jgi:hypothetical protein
MTSKNTNPAGNPTFTIKKATGIRRVEPNPWSNQPDQGKGDYLGGLQRATEHAKNRQDDLAHPDSGESGDSN